MKSSCPNRTLKTSAGCSAYSQRKRTDEHQVPRYLVVVCSDGAAVTSTQARRVEQAKGGLTPKERAILAVRYWFRKETEDPLLRRHVPQDELKEFERFLGLFYTTNEQIYRDMVFWCEWLTQIEICVGWAESLAALLLRTEELGAALGPRLARVKLTPLPTPARGMRRTLPLAKIFGPSPADEDPLPETWEAMRDGLVVELKGSIILRSQESVAFDRIIAEYIDLVGADVIALEVRELVDGCRIKVIELHGAVETLGGSFALPEPTDEVTANLRARVDWDVLKPPVSASPRIPKWIAEREAAELAEAELRWEAELRESKSEPKAG